MKNLIDSAIGLTFAKNNRHDFFSALAQVLMSKYFNSVRWVRCEGWNDNNVFGIVIPELQNKGYEESETLSFYKCNFSFFFGYAQGSDRVKSKIRKLFVYLNEQFSSNTICRHLMLDWFWNLMLLSKGKITSLKEIMTECENNVIHKIVDSVIIKNNHTENDFGMREKQLLKSIEELSSKYYEYFGDGEDFRLLLKEYLCGDWGEGSKLPIRKRPGKLFYLRSIEKVVKRNDTIIKQLRDFEEQDFKEKYLHFLLEDNVFLDIRSRFYDLFCLYLENQSYPYFFIYNPFDRLFYYRGIVTDLDHIVMPDEPDELEAIKNQVIVGLQNLRQKIGKDLQMYDYLILFIQSVGQPFDEDLIRYLFVGRKPLWIENFYDDFKVPPIQAPENPSESDIRRYIEQKILRIFGSGKICSFFFAPLICDGQYRGNLYVRVDGKRQIFTKLKRIMPILSNYCSQKIEDYYYQQFMKETLEDDKPTFKLILDKLPYLLNIEAAGYIPIKKVTEADGDELLQCSNYNIGNKRKCEIWGFSDASASYDNLHLKNMECIGEEKEGRCLWDELYRDSRRIGERTKLIFFDISIYNLIHEIARHCKLTKTVNQLDIRQSYTWVYSKSEFMNVLDGDLDASFHKVLFSWKLLNRREDHDYLLWLAIDMSPWVFNRVKSSIITKLDTIAEIKKVLEERIEFFRTFEHDTSRFVDYFGNMDPLLKSIIKDRSTVMKYLLGESIPAEDSMAKEIIMEDINKLFALMNVDQIDLDIQLDIQTSINGSFWYFIETILTNLISNLFENATNSDSSKVSIELCQNADYLYFDYHQAGSFSFNVGATDIQTWLKGYYLIGSDKGLGHTIIQKVTDVLNGKLTIIVNNNELNYQVTKYGIIEGAQINSRNGETNIQYKFIFPA